ncbi:MAG: transcription antitermination factor NusB [Firmicutes bacterium]|nr:transcription antitermination factor NusB [Bacillota bacterium]
MSRRLARQTALQTLYQIDIAKISAEEGLATRLEETELEEPDQQYTANVVKSVVLHLEEIDSLLGKFAVDWAIDRMPIVDRNILRLAIGEILYAKDIPVKVSINEAVELAKIFSSDESARFVNGVLGAIVDYLALGEQNDG